MTKQTQTKILQFFSTQVGSNSQYNLGTPRSNTQCQRTPTSPPQKESPLTSLQIPEGNILLPDINNSKSLFSNKPQSQGSSRKEPQQILFRPCHQPKHLRTLDQDTMTSPPHLSQLEPNERKETPRYTLRRQTPTSTKRKQIHHRDIRSHLAPDKQKLTKRKSQHSSRQTNKTPPHPTNQSPSQQNHSQLTQKDKHYIQLIHHK